MVVAPPKFAPQLDSVDHALRPRPPDGARRAGHRADARPRTRSDIYPILQRAREISAVEDASGTTDLDGPGHGQTLRQQIFNKLVDPASAGPAATTTCRCSTGEDWRLTSTQYAQMQRWNNNHSLSDWAGSPAPEAASRRTGLDRAALTKRVGGAFFPGIEAGGAPTKPIIVATIYVGAAEPLRLDHTAVAPGRHDMWMALPWQADFNACADHWWPVPRPNDVIPQGTSTDQAWKRGVGNDEDMVAKWHTLGFVVRQGAQHVEVERCDTARHHPADAAAQLPGRAAGADGHGARSRRSRSPSR